MAEFNDSKLDELLKVIRDNLILNTSKTLNRSDFTSLIISKELFEVQPDLEVEITRFSSFDKDSRNEKTLKEYVSFKYYPANDPFFIWVSPEVFLNKIKNPEIKRIFLFNLDLLSEKV